MADTTKENGSGERDPTPMEDMSVADKTRRVIDMLEGRRDTLEMALAGAVSVEEFIVSVGACYMKDDKLQKSSLLSIYQAALECAQAGLKPDGDQAVIIGYYDKHRDGKNKGGYAANFQAGYKGLIKLMLRAGAKKVEARVVYDGDHFEYGYGTAPFLEHVPERHGEQGQIRATYGVIWLPSGETQFEVCERWELAKIRNAAQASNSPAYQQWEEQMYRKAPVRRLAKYVELNARVSAAFRHDAALEGGDVRARLGDADPALERRTLEEQAEAHALRQEEGLKARIAARSQQEGQGGVTLGEGDPPEGEEVEASESEPEDLSPEEQDLLASAYRKALAAAGAVETTEEEMRHLDAMREAADVDGLIALEETLRGRAEPEEEG